MGIMHTCTHPGCKKQFDRKYNLKCHLRIHSDEKPYECHHKNCTRSFRWKSSLNHHLLSLDHTPLALRRERKARIARRRQQHLAAIAAAAIDHQPPLPSLPIRTTVHSFHTNMPLQPPLRPPENSLPDPPLSAPPLLPKPPTHATTSTLSPAPPRMPLQPPLVTAHHPPITLPKKTTMPAMYTPPTTLPGRNATTLYDRRGSANAPMCRLGQIMPPALDIPLLDNFNSIESLCAPVKPADIMDRDLRGMPLLLGQKSPLVSVFEDSSAVSLLNTIPPALDPLFPPCTFDAASLRSF